MLLRDSVALRKESVDRNNHPLRKSDDKCWSLSARRAWIEIPGVLGLVAGRPKSLSARRAWIEMLCGLLSMLINLVSLSARRAWIEMTQGVFNLFTNPGSLSARRAWIEMAVSAALQLIPLGRSPQGERG